MRKKINLLLWGALSIGSTSVFGADVPADGEIIPVDVRITQAFNKFSAKLQRDFGVDFTTDESMGEVVRFRKGLIAHLKKQEADLKELRAVEKLIREKYRGTETALVEMFKDLTEVKVGDDDDEEEEDEDFL